MFKLFLLTFSCVISLTALPQKKAKEVFYLFDKEWKPVNKEQEAVYFGKMVKLSDTSYQWDEYNYMGPKLKRLTYRDENQDVLNGYQEIYRATGFIDSSGYILQGKLQGDWVYMNDTGKVIFTKQFENGKLISVKDHLKEPNTSDTSKSYDDEKESAFPGGLEKWQKYLVKTMNYPERAARGAITGEVIVTFLVDSKGVVSDPHLLKSVEYSLDEAALEIIKKSPDWIPGYQNGKHVKTYKKQPFVFGSKPR